MNKFILCRSVVVGVVSLTMLSGCGSAEKSVPTTIPTEKTPPAMGGAHTMPDDKKMDGKDMK